jgi:hypothetical protein
MLTRKRTTLADLDSRWPRRPGASRARALGGDVLRQIDLLKGRSAQSRRRGIAALLPAPARRANGLASARAFDAGAPVRVSGAYSDAFSASLAAGASWPPIAYADDDQAALTFAVEVFEVTDQIPAIEPPSPPATNVAPLAPDVTVEVPITAAFSRGQEEDGLLGLDLSAVSERDREESDQFEREIQAILSGQTIRPAAQSLPASPQRPSSLATAPPSAPRPHDVFEQMGQNMAYATAFNLPAMELGKRFDQIEQELAREEAAERRPPVSLELTDDEITRSLGLPPSLPADTVPAPTTAAPEASRPVAAPAIPPSFPVSPVSDGSSEASPLSPAVPVAEAPPPPPPSPEPGSLPPSLLAPPATAPRTLSPETPSPETPRAPLAAVAPSVPANGRLQS